jgi:hypothetical protein
MSIEQALRETVQVSDDGPEDMGRCPDARRTNLSAHPRMDPVSNAGAGRAGAPGGCGAEHSSHWGRGPGGLTNQGTR